MGRSKYYTRIKILRKTRGGRSQRLRSWWSFDDCEIAFERFNDLGNFVVNSGFIRVREKQASSPMRLRERHGLQGAEVTAMRT